MSMSDQLSFGAHAVGETPLPTGVMTFFFTDVEGSTRLWRRFRDSMRSALACHGVLIEDLVSKHEGSWCALEVRATVALPSFRVPRMPWLLRAPFRSLSSASPGGYQNPYVAHGHPHW